MGVYIVLEVIIKLDWRKEKQWMIENMKLVINTIYHECFLLSSKSLSYHNMLQQFLILAIISLLLTYTLVTLQHSKKAEQ